MSTEIKGVRGCSVNMRAVHTSGVSLELISGGEEMAWSALRRADFLKAVADELDVIVIEKAAYPACKVSGDSASFDYGDVGHSEPIPRGLDADELIALGIALKTAPPVDEAQVERIAKAVRAEDATRGATASLDAYLPMAASLYRGGIRAPEVTP